MSREFLGINGKLVYGISLDSNECVVFDRFGKAVGRKTGIIGYSESKTIREVNILSVIGDAVNTSSEVFFDGMVAVVPENYVRVVQVLRQFVVLENPLAYRILYEVGVMQVVLFCRKGPLSLDGIASILGLKLVWKSV